MKCPERGRLTDLSCQAKEPLNNFAMLDVSWKTVWLVASFPDNSACQRTIDLRQNSLKSAGYRPRGRFVSTSSMCESERFWKTTMDFEIPSVLRKIILAPRSRAQKNRSGSFHPVVSDFPKGSKS